MEFGIYALKVNIGSQQCLQGCMSCQERQGRGGIGKGLGLEICKFCKGREEPREDCVSPPASFLTLLRAVSLACISSPGKAGRSVRHGVGIVLGSQSYTICSITVPWEGTFPGVPYPETGDIKTVLPWEEKMKTGRECGRTKLLALQRVRRWNWQCLWRQWHNWELWSLADPGFDSVSSIPSTWGLNFIFNLYLQSISGWG